MGCRRNFYADLQANGSNRITLRAMPFTFLYNDHNISCKNEPNFCQTLTDTHETHETKMDKIEEEINGERKTLLKCI